MMKFIIGYDATQTVKAAVIADWGMGGHLAHDVIDMLKSGLTINVIEAEKIVIGEKFEVTIP